MKITKLDHGTEYLSLTECNIPDTPRNHLARYFKMAYNDAIGKTPSPISALHNYRRLCTVMVSTPIFVSIYLVIL